MQHTQKVRKHTRHTFKSSEISPERRFLRVARRLRACRHAVGSSSLPTLLARAPARYHPLASIARDGWAWEFLRRNADYGDAWHSGLRDPGCWNLHGYVDPTASADVAPAMWRKSGYILPVSQVSASADHTHALDMRDARCDVYRLRVSDTREHVLILDDGRRLQLDVTGDPVVGRALLSPVAGHADASPTRRMALVRVLDHFTVHGRLPRQLYRGESGAYRLLFILMAHDGVRGGTALQELAPVLFGTTRLQQADTRQMRALRAQTSRAVARGEWLVQEGYRTLLA